MNLFELRDTQIGYWGWRRMDEDVLDVLECKSAPQAVPVCACPRARQTNSWVQFILDGRQVHVFVDVFCIRPKRQIRYRFTRSEKLHKLFRAPNS